MHTRVSKYNCGIKRIFFLKRELRSYQMSLEVFLWIIIGGLFVAILGAGSVYYLNETPTTKQLSRDFIIGSFFTGFLYPLIPESFDEIKGAISSTASDLQKSLVSTTKVSGLGDTDIKIGPANF
jgi:hypothetical protein